MRNHTMVRPAKPEEAGKFFEWAESTPNNEFDPEVPRYPSTVTLCAYDKDGPVVFMPIQQPFVMDALAVKPGAEKADVAVALRELLHAAVTQAHIKGIGEIYFLGTEDGTDHIAENQLFEKLPYTVYRLKLKDLEK